QQARVEWNGKEDRSPLAGNVHAGEGTVALDLGNVHVQLRPGNEVVRPPGLGGAIPMNGGDIFDRPDQGKKGYLDEADVRDLRPLRSFGLFGMMDRDGDGKVTEKELRAYIEQTSNLQARASAGCVALVFIDEGRGLFDLLDANHDGRLSVPELRQAPHLLER